jgi:hypothetical protein
MGLKHCLPIRKASLAPAADDGSSLTAQQLHIEESSQRLGCDPRRGDESFRKLSGNGRCDRLPNTARPIMSLEG